MNNFIIYILNEYAQRKDVSPEINALGQGCKESIESTHLPQLHIPSGRPASLNGPFGLKLLYTWAIIL